MAKPKLQKSLAQLMLEGVVPAKTLIQIRWVGVGAQIIALLVANNIFSLETELLFAALLLVTISCMVNLWAEYSRLRSPTLAPDVAAIYLAFDIAQFAGVLSLTGGLDNPLGILLLAPMAVAASLLSFWWVAGLAMLTLICLTSNATWHYPSPLLGQNIVLPAFYSWAVWLGLSLATLFIAGYTWSAARASRLLNQALVDTRLSLAEARQATALGALAAAAAHELGTPLATISLVAKELLYETPDNSPAREDLQLLVSQAERCRSVLQQLTRRPSQEGGVPFETVPFNALLEEVITPYRRPQIEVSFGATPATAAQLLVRHSPELMHAIGNIAQNSMQFARTWLHFHIHLNADTVQLRIQDDGPGIPAAIIGRMGEPYLSHRPDYDRPGHMGLGIFIARTLMANLGGRIEFANAAEGGADIALTWPRSAAFFGKNPATPSPPSSV